MNTEGKSRYFFLTIVTILAATLLSSCGYKYKCGITFGASTCNSSGGGIGTGGGSTANAAFIFNIVTAGTIDESSLTSGSGAALEKTPGFTAPTVPNNDQASEIVVAQKKFVYAAFPSSQSLFAWSLDSSGNLSAIAGSPYSIASLGGVVVPNPLVYMTSIAVNPAGTLLFIGAAGLGEIDVYQISSTGALTQVPGAPFSTGAFQPWNLSVDALGKYVYAMAGPEGLQQQVAAYSIASSGALTVVPGSPFSFGMWQMQGDPSGKYMIGISGKSTALTGLTNDASLYVFSIQQSGANAGALTQVSGSPFPTVFPPLNLAVQPVASNGNFVYTFGALSPVEGYQLDVASGALTPLSASPFKTLGTGAWGQFDQSGSFLFIFATDRTHNSSFGVLDVASATGDLTEPTGPLTVDPSTYFTVTDVP